MSTDRHQQSMHVVRFFAYCTQALHLSEHATYGRIEAARAARRYPVILDLLADGSITLTTVTLLASELTPENHRAVLESARHKSKRDILLVVAGIIPPSVVGRVSESPNGLAGVRVGYLDENGEKLIAERVLPRAWDSWVQASLKRRP